MIALEAGVLQGGVAWEIIHQATQLDLYPVLKGMHGEGLTDSISAKRRQAHGRVGGQQQTHVFCEDATHRPGAGCRRVAGLENFPIIERRKDR